jgi:chorismate mutase/prephenate dehydratase
MEKLVAAYQGVEGCHSSLVLKSYFKKAGFELQAEGAQTFRQVAMNVISGKADVGLLPVDNAIAGTIREGYDLLAQYDLVPISEIEWKMDHRLLAPAGAELGKIREVLAHPLVLEECGRFLGTLIGARVLPVEDTGLAARDVAQSKDPARAAIAPPEAGELYGLTELATNIADHPGNYTRFILFRAQTSRELARKLGRTQPADQRKTSLLLSTAHEAGSLVKCLNILNSAGINLSKLESRPKLGKAWEYLFYVDFEGDVESPRVAEALSKLRTEAQYIQVIGSYDRHRASDEAHNMTAAVSTAPLEPVAHEGHTSGAPHGWSPELLPSSAKGWPKAARSAKPQGSRFKIGPVEVGGDEFVVIAGPCSVESREQVLKTAQAVRENGAVMLRGGVFKPRTNPYAFQGMGWEGLSLLSEAGRATGMPIVSEVMSLEQVERMARECDVLQIGARNMQNFDLLKAVGKTDRTILLSVACPPPSTSFSPPLSTCLPRAIRT